MIAENIINSSDIDVKVGNEASLAKFIWFRTGGPAQYLVRPSNTQALSDFLKQLDHTIPVMAIGVGSNMIVRDGGVDGVVIRLPKSMGKVEILEDNKVRAGGAAMGISLASAARDAGIAGLEFQRGIPGTVGGAVRMNAGAYGDETCDVLIEATLVMRNGDIAVWSNDDFEYRYRHSAVPKGAIVVEALFQGRAGDSIDIAAKMDKIAADREASQPLRSRTGGSTFKNPDGKKAWQLVDEAGCRGLRIGDAQVSEKHTNFLLNLGDASSADIEALGEEVRRRVFEYSGVTLEWEVQRVGKGLDHG